MEYGERFYYVGPGGPFEQFGTGQTIEKYIEENAVPLKNETE